MEYTVFETATGKILWSGSCMDADYDALHIPEGADKLPLLSSPSNHYVENGNLYPIPPKTSIIDQFDYSTKTMKVATEAEIQAIKLASIRAERDRILAATVDRINPLRWSEMSDTDRADVEAFRQALLDITLQSDLDNIIWPTWRFGQESLYIG